MMRTIVALLLLIVGVQFWLVLGRGDWGYLPGPITWAAILLVALLPPVNRRIARLLERIAQPSPRTRLVIAVMLSIAAGVYLYCTAVRQQRDFFLKIHDEHSYAIQARMLAVGRLWTAAHPAAESFDSPYVLVRPVYASMYFPGTALMLVPGVWLGLPWWATPLILSAACVGVLYHVVTELIDGDAGLLAALMLVSLQTFRELSLRLYSQTPMLLLALCLIWAWLAWRRDRRWQRALIIGVIAGWILIVRPLDAIVFLAPVIIGIVLDLRKPELRTIAAIAAGALPFVSLQLIANRGITGSWLTTPHAFYADRDFPGVTLGFHTPRPMSMLVTTVPQKRALYRDTIPAIEKHRPGNVVPELMRNRLPITVSTTLPNNLLVILLPLGVAAALFARKQTSPAWILAAPLPLFLLAYAFYLFYFAHYLLVLAPAMIFLIVIAAHELPALWPRMRNPLVVLVTFTLAIISLDALPEFHPRLRDDVGAGDLGEINKLLADLPHRPAIVLFRYANGDNAQREPVYNTSTSNIDDADVIRAHDLPGEANRTLLEYYAERQPQRHVYRIIRAADGSSPQLIDLGPVGAVSQSPQ
jgi:hypothetical protein